MIYHADLLDALPLTEPADLIYFDPPFNTGRKFRTRNGELAYDDRHDDYLRSMRAWLTAITAALAPAGSLYVHCDPRFSHHVRIRLDELLGASAWRNTIVWRYRRWPARAKRYQRMHDDILFYSRDGAHFEQLYGYESLAPSTLRTFGDREQRADFSSGRRKPGRTERRSKGPPLSDVWEIGVLAPRSRERTGYPTQKPEALMERIVLSSTRPGQLVLDPACGSGTMVAVAERLGRRAIGIDSSAVAVSHARGRLTPRPVLAADAAGA